MRHLMFTLLWLLSCASTEHAALPPREHLRGLIAGYEQGPERSRLDAAPGDVVGGLLALATDTSEKRFYRARALTALGLYPEEERAYQLLSQVVQQAEAGLLERAAAVRSLSRGFGQARSDEVARLLSPLLQSDSLLLQRAAEESLRLNPSPLASEALSQRLR